MSFTVCLQPTYGTPLVEGYSQVRVYNGFNCSYTFTTSTDANADINIGPLSMYQRLDLDAVTFPNTTYTLRGVDGACANNPYTGTFSVSGATANSFFISSSGVHPFVDNVDKPIDGVGVR